MDAVLDHETDDLSLGEPWPRRVGHGVVVDRRLGYAGQQRCFAEGEVGRRLVEVAVGGGLDAVGAVAIEDVLRYQARISCFE